MLSVKFSKIESVGNDYIYIDDLRQDLKRKKLPDLAVQICDRNRGVGGDGLILFKIEGKGHYSVRIFNPDGSEAGMCGNGIRGAVAFAYNVGYSKRKVIRVDTRAVTTVSEILKIGGDGDPYTIRTDLATPDFETKSLPMKAEGDTHIGKPLVIGGKKRELSALSIGNPHVVLFVDSFDFDWQELGRSIQESGYFPEGVNVNFARLKSKSRLSLRVLERGAGATLACGSGAAATVASGALLGRTSRRVTVELPGGELLVDWDESDDHIHITGESRPVCRGEFFSV
jgi:diaminopimelate epimerase